MTQGRQFRCAVYTRKSSDEGLEQSFNSLHAQRESCEAYIKSQAGEGWVLRRDRYDDGGYSGGMMDRPGLRRLLADVVAQRVDVVVVYKVDRLTRYLPDFAKIIETFDGAGVSFVSVTQPFNTTSSMGRLTLNVLLSFAQFEREVTSERIRDKIAASKAKGMWMGGVPPLGYDWPTSQMTRALVVNEPEAHIVRFIFRRYLEVGDTLALQRALEEEGVRSKAWVSAQRRQVGGCVFSRGALLHLLKNRTYLGQIVHKGQSYPGRHPAILDQDTFDAAQAVLARNSRKRKTHVPRAAKTLLVGLIFDGAGQRMKPAFGRGAHKRCYSYYASGPIVGGPDNLDDDTIRRTPCAAVDDLVMSRLHGLGPPNGGEQLDRAGLRAMVARVEIHATTVQIVLRTRPLATWCGSRSAGAMRGRLPPGEKLMAEPYDNRLVRLVLPVRLKVRGGRTWISAPDGTPAPPLQKPDLALIKRIRTAHAILKECAAMPDASVDTLRSARAPSGSHQRRLARWAFLAPDIQEAILRGRLPVKSGDLDVGARIPLLWSAQRELFGV